jgi:thiol-disulfide isomerase/thioredoxin
MRTTRAALAGLILLAIAVPVGAAPKASIPTWAALPVVERAPYDPNANADAAVNAAFKRARKSGKRVFIDMGGNWCADCIILSNFMQLPEIKTFVAQHYEVAVVDVGRFDKNLQIPARFGIVTRLAGVPAVIIAEPDGRFVNRGHIAALADARHMTPQGIADWIAQWAKAPRPR